MSNQNGEVVLLLAVAAILTIATIATPGDLKPLQEVSLAIIKVIESNAWPTCLAVVSCKALDTFGPKKQKSQR